MLCRGNNLTGLFPDRLARQTRRPFRFLDLSNNNIRSAPVMQPTSKQLTMSLDHTRSPTFELYVQVCSVHELAVHYS